MNAKAKKPALTESQLLGRLRARYGEKSGNGYAYAFIPGVRSAAAFEARRTIDAYAMSLWPSRGLTLTAFECRGEIVVAVYRFDRVSPPKGEGP